MEVGKLFHALFQRCLQRIEPQQNMIEFGEQWYHTFPEGVEEEKYHINNLDIIAANWLKYNSVYFRDYEPVLVEKYLEMPLCDGVMFFGVLDAVVRNARGELWIVESKSTGDIDRNKHYWLSNAQGMGYWELVRYHLGREPKGVLWNGVEVRKIPPYDGVMTKKCGKHKVKYSECQSLHVRMEMVGPVTYTRDRLDLWQNQVSGAAWKFERLLENDMDFSQGRLMYVLLQEGRFTYPGCSSCDFRPWCDAGRPVAMMEQMMEPYVWPTPEILLTAQES